MLGSKEEIFRECFAGIFKTMIVQEEKYIRVHGENLPERIKEIAARSLSAVSESAKHYKGWDDLKREEGFKAF